MIIMIIALVVFGILHFIFGMPILNALFIGIYYWIILKMLGPEAIKILKEGKKDEKK